MAVSTQIPFASPLRTTEALREDIEAAVIRVLDSGWYILGPEVDQFEREFSAFLGVGHAVGVGTGTDAIELALRALQLEPGDEVITQANTCVPTVAAIERSGAVPVLCDVDRESAAMDPESFSAVITPRTRAVIPVHLYGQCGPLDVILKIANDNDIFVVEDCAQAHGATLSGHVAGTMGDLGCFSFYPTKNLGAVGDGGAVVTNDDELADRLRKLRIYGQIDRYDHAIAGVNSRLDEMQAAILRAKLPHLDAGNRARIDIAQRYTEALLDTPVRPLRVLPSRTHVFHLFVVVTEEREEFCQNLDRLGVGTIIHYPKPIHGHPPYSQLAVCGSDLSNSDFLAKRVVSLPLYPELTEEEVELVATTIRQVALQLPET